MNPPLQTSGSALGPIYNPSNPTRAHAHNRFHLQRFLPTPLSCIKAPFLQGSTMPHSPRDYSPDTAAFRVHRKHLTVFISVPVSTRHSRVAPVFLLEYLIAPPSMPQSGLYSMLTLLIKPAFAKTHLRSWSVTDSIMGTSSRSSVPQLKPRREINRSYLTMGTPRRLIVLGNSLSKR